MLERRYGNAIVRITIPTEEQKENIKKATEVFLNNIAKEIYVNGNNNKTRIGKNT